MVKCYRYFLDKLLLVIMETNIQLDQVLDLNILEQYTQAIGGKALLGSVDLFSQQYPEYLKQLKEHFNNDAFDLVAEEGHKMKGAAGSIGLARLSQWGQIIQHREHDKWLENTTLVIQLLEDSYRSDIEVLRQYLLNS